MIKLPNIFFICEFYFVGNVSCIYYIYRKSHNTIQITVLYNHFLECTLVKFSNYRSLPTVPIHKYLNK